LYASLLDYTFGSASLVASARFSAACYGANREVHNRLKPFSTPFLDGVSGRDQVGLGRPLLIHPKADRRPKRLQLRQPFQGHNFRIARDPSQSAASAKGDSDFPLRLREARRYTPMDARISRSNRSNRRCQSKALHRRLRLGHSGSVQRRPPPRCSPILGEKPARLPALSGSARVTQLR
jgi:hypothetical protein